MDNVPGRIADEAARWAVRAACGEMSEAALGELDAWITADRRHRGAYLRARAGFCAMEDAVRGDPRGTGAVNDNLSSPALALPRLRRWGGAMASAALAACAAALLLTGAWNGPFGATNEAPAERVALADGSVATFPKAHG